MNDATMIRLLTVQEQFVANMIAGALESAGIDARIDGEHVSNLRMQIPATIRVMVYEQDLETAKSILEEFRESMKNVDWSQIDVGQP